jgi:gas vesicle protein
MSSRRLLFAGFVCGAVFGAAGALLLGEEPSILLRNGVLKGWEVTRDDESLLCKDPIVFIRAKQIECE